MAIIFGARSLIGAAMLIWAGGQPLYADPAPRLLGLAGHMPSGVVQLAWSGSGAAYKIMGKRLEVTLASNGIDSLEIEVNGSPRRLELKSGEHRYTLAEGLAQAVHDIRVYKRTEALVGSIFLRQADTDGTFLAPQSTPRRILVVGDSVSNGYGVEGHGPNCTFSAETQNYYKTYAARIGRIYNADTRVIAESGIGLVLNWGNASNKHIPDRLAQLSDDELRNDVIVVHLGTNDFANGASQQNKNFTSAYSELLSSLRKRNPNAFIYGAIGPMLDGAALEDAKTAIKKAVDEQRDRGDLRVRFVFFGLPENPVFGCDWHPSEKTHEHMSKVLGAYIAKDTGWDNQLRN